jgi:ATP-dependent RNA helicase DeaD
LYFSGKQKEKYMKFEEFNLRDELNQAINKAGFTEPSPVQEQAIPIILDGHDIIAQAQTGTGKTAAFGLPVLNKMSCNGEVETLVIVPTRELAMQVSDELFKFGKFLNVKTATVYGGSSYTRQIKHVENASIVVATPGRLLDLLKNNQIKINPKWVILDEADEMLDMGFLEDIKNIFKFIPQDRQTLLFSATMPAPIKKLAESILKAPKLVAIAKKDITNTNITQSYYVVEEYERDDALMRLFDYKDPSKSIVFCKMKRDVDRLATYLVSQGFSAKGLHGDMEQRQREEVIRSFKADKIEVLVATDVAARGLDVSGVSHVFNYQLPFDAEPYVHRIGRTGRGGQSGVAVSIVSPAEFRSLKKIQQTIGSQMEAKIVPTIEDVKDKNQGSFVNSIKNAKIDDKVCDIIDSLKDEFDLSTIAYKLATILTEQTKVSGKNKIGKSAKDIEFLLEKMKNDRGNGGSRNRNRGRRGGSNSNGRSGNSHGRSGGSNSSRGQRAGSSSRGGRSQNRDSSRSGSRNKG